MLLSILTPTLIERKEPFKSLQDKIRKQIEESSFKGCVEHLVFEDNRDHSIGYKRNILMRRAKGDFIVFLDDDDDVSEDYIERLCKTIQTNLEADCIGIRGIITFNGSHPHTFVHSLEYRKYFKKDNIYCRPILHINPINREIAKQYTFADVNYSEDIDWAFRIMKDGVLKNEYMIDTPIYFYNSRRRWWYQWLIDKTETLRQLFGLQWYNRIRILRWIRFI